VQRVRQVVVAGRRDVWAIGHGGQDASRAQVSIGGGSTGVLSRKKGCAAGGAGDS